MTVVTKALDVVTPTLRDVAGWVGATYASVRAWRLGTRTPSPDQVMRLAREFRHHAQRLDRLADRLEEVRA